MSPHVIDRLSAFLDDELPAAERREVEAHLETCPSCAKHLSELALLDAAARGLGVAAPAGYFEALPGRIRQRLRGRRRVVPVWGWAAAAALLIAVLTPLLQRDPFARQAQPAAVPRAEPPRAVAAPEAGRSVEGRVSGRARPVQPAPAPQETRATSSPAPIPERVAADSAAPLQRTVPGSPVTTTPARDVAKTEEAPAPPPGAAGFAPAPGSVAATPLPAATNEETLSIPREEPAPAKGSAQAGAGLASKARRKQDLEQDRSTEAKESDAVRSHGPASAEEARSLRERWRERARRNPEGSAGDEARLGMVEAGAVAYRLERDPRDLEILRRDAEAYLARPEARRPDRVREILRSVEETP